MSRPARLGPLLLVLGTAAGCADKDDTPRLPPPPGETTFAGSLATSWNEDLAVEVESIPVEAVCNDKDGDGYLNALSCPGAAPGRLDCDDANKSVTPDVERWIRPGPFLMGSNSMHAGVDETPVHVVQMTGYCIDRDEVTAEQFAAWLRKKSRHPAGDPSDLRNIDAAGHVVPGREKHPVQGVTWAEARAYCKDQRKDLPTEAQWEKAARGGCELGSDPYHCDPDDLRPFPWGTDEPSCQTANHQLSMTGAPTLCVGDTLPVGSLPAGNSPYGNRDLAGNVWEYMLDYYHPAVYSRQRTRTNPMGPSSGEYHALRGGSWSTFSTNMRAANRFHDLVMGSAVGFRCARPDVPSKPDPVTPVEMVTLSGEVTIAPLLLTGRALYITAFALDDMSPDGMPIVGRSPAAELRLTPNGKDTQPFKLRVPAADAYRISAALDAGSTDSSGGFVPASGSGGVGMLVDPVPARSDQEELRIALQAHALPAQHAPGKASGKAPGRPPGQPPGQPPPAPGQR